MKKKYISFSRRGFTLLELIVVLFIISLLAGLVFPSFHESGGRQLASDARRIASLLQYLNDSSVAAKETYSVDFDFQRGSVSWKGPEGDKSERIKTLAGVDLQSKGMIGSGQVSVIFSPLGVGEHLEILLRNEESEMRVTLNPISGRAKIVTGNEQDG